MNKELLISIKPEHLVNILNGKKTLELRKTVPKDFKGWVNIYCTKSEILEESFLGYRVLPINSYYRCGIGRSLSGSVVARFWFDEFEYIAEFSAREMLINVLDRLSITKNELKNYLKGKYGYAWHIKQLEIFDKPKELSEFYKQIDGLDENGGFILDNLKDGEFVKIPELRKKYLLSRPPQSYQFVYVKE